MSPSMIPHDRECTPAFAWRGFMLDCARTFWPSELIHEIITLLGRYGFNRLHLHLTDDAGWRIQIPEFPELTQTGAHLPREAFDWYDNVDADKRAEMIASAPQDSTWGYYTDDEIREIVIHASSEGIEVIPEIDLPGHMHAAIRSYPELGDPALAKLPPEDWSHRNDLLWPTDQSWALIDAALTHVALLFPSPIIHIGGDECHFEAWESDHALMGSLASQGIRNGRQLQESMTRRALEILHSLGKRAAGWDELTEIAPANVLDDTLIIAWRGFGEGPRRAALSGQPWVYGCCDQLYLNRLAGDASDEPAAMFGVITPERILTEVMEEITQAASAPIGIQSALWCEFVPTREQLYYQLFPRLLAVAEVAWHGLCAFDEAELRERIRAEMQWLAERGICGRKA